MTLQLNHVCWEYDDGPEPAGELRARLSIIPPGGLPPNEPMPTYIVRFPVESVTIVNELLVEIKVPGSTGGAA